MSKARSWLVSLTALFFLLSSVLAACAEPVGSGQEAESIPEAAGEETTEQGAGIEQDPTGGDEELPPIIPDTTKVVVGTAMQSLEEISPEGTLTFTAATAEAEAFLESVEAGHVLASNVSQLAPDGFLRKVVGVSRSGNRFVFETVDASLEDAIEQGVVEISRALTTDDLARLPQEQGIRVAKMRPGRAPGVISVKIDNVSLADKVFANGEVEVEPKFNFKVVIKNHQIQEVLFTNETNEKVTLELQGQLPYKDVKLSKEIKRLRFKPFTIWVGPLPVVIRPKLVVVVGVRGDLPDKITTSVVHNGVLRAGVHYDRANQWTLEPTDFSHTYDFNPPQVATGASLKAYAGPRLKLYLYTAPGPYAQVDGYLQLTADALKTPWWELYGGLEAEIGVEIEVKRAALLGRPLVLSYSKSVLDEQWLIADAGGPLPGLTRRPTPAPVAGPDQVVGRVMWGRTGVPGANVEVKPPGAFYQEPVLASAVADAGGYFSLDKLPAGSYVIYALGPGPEFWDFTGYPLDIPPGRGDVDVGTLYVSQMMQLLGPPDGGVLSTTRPTLRWDAFPGAAFYQVNILDDQGRDVVRDSTAGTSYTLPFDLQRGRNYEWFVQAMDSNGTEIAYFASWYFAIQP